MRPSIVVVSVIFVFLGMPGCGGDSGSSSSASGTTDEGATEGTTVEGTTDEGITDEGTTDEGTTDEGTTDEGTTDEGTTSGDAISFATVYKDVLEPQGCTAGYCHAGESGGLLMNNMETAYKNLIKIKNATPSPCEALLRVVPGSPEDSMLWIRVRQQSDDCVPEEKKMPIGSNGLDAADAQLIYDWIATGANP